jgi:hypothetical protein
MFAAPNIVELRLEAKFRTPGEAYLLTSILGKNLKTMRRLALDVTDWKLDNDIIKSIPLFTLPLGTETLSFRIFTNLNPPAYGIFVSLTKL